MYWSYEIIKNTKFPNHEFREPARIVYTKSTYAGLTALIIYVYYTTPTFRSGLMTAKAIMRKSEARKSQSQYL